MVGKCASIRDGCVVVCVVVSNCASIRDWYVLWLVTVLVSGMGMYCGW